MNIATCFQPYKLQETLTELEVRRETIHKMLSQDYLNRNGVESATSELNIIAGVVSTIKEELNRIESLYDDTNNS